MPFVPSIGPFHHGKTSCQAMEEQKWRLLRDFLSRGDHINLDLCISEMKLLEERTQRCYSEMVDLDSNGFVEMILLDGCFVLEYFLKKKGGNWYSSYVVGWSHVSVYLDLVLLENQIPFFVIEKLCEIGVKLEDRTNFVNNLICNMFPAIQNYPLIPNPPAQIDNLTHLYHHCSVPNPKNLGVLIHSKSFPLTKMFSRIKNLLLWFLSWVLTRFPGHTSQSLSLTFPNSTENLSMNVIPCASDLQDTGIKFRPKNNPKHIFDIAFVDGVLEIPRLTIGDGSGPLFINLIAFEQCNWGKMNCHFSCFATFLDMLVNTQKDAMILQQCGIIEIFLCGEEDFAHFCNQLTEGMPTEEDHFFTELFREVNRHCESSWNRQRAKLIRDYFSSPWIIISLVAALVLLVLTCVQSFFAAFAYFVPPS